MRIKKSVKESISAPTDRLDGRSWEAVKRCYNIPVNHPWYVKYTYPMLRGVFGPIVRGIWIKEVTGMEHIPKKGPVIVAFNHQSYLGITEKETVNGIQENVEWGNWMV